MNRKQALTLGAVGLSAVLAAPLVFAQQAGPGNKNILIICGTENNIYTACTSLDDVWLRNHLRLDMGHNVTTIAHNADAAEMLAAADAADLVIIPESVTSGQVGRKVVSTTTPIIQMESFLQDEFGFVNPEAPTVDPGTPDGVTLGQLEDAWEMLADIGLTIDIQYEVPAAPAGADAAAIAALAEDAYEAAVEAALEAAAAEIEKPLFGAIPDVTDLIIVDPTHPLAAGLSGRVTVYPIPAEMNWAMAETLAPGVHVVATLSGYPEAATIYYIPEGGELFDGTPAPGLRITLFVENSNAIGTHHRMTEDGHRLFDAAVTWALSEGAAM